MNEKSRSVHAAFVSLSLPCRATCSVFFGGGVLSVLFCCLVSCLRKESELGSELCSEVSWVEGGGETANGVT